MDLLGEVLGKKASAVSFVALVVLGVNDHREGEVGDIGIGIAESIFPSAVDIKEVAIGSGGLD